MRCGVTRSHSFPVASANQRLAPAASCVTKRGRSAVQAAGKPALNEGDRVGFELEDDRRGRGKPAPSRLNSARLAGLDYTGPQSRHCHLGVPPVRDLAQPHVHTCTREVTAKPVLGTAFTGAIRDHAARTKDARNNK